MHFWYLHLKFDFLWLMIIGLSQLSLGLVTLKQRKMLCWISQHICNFAHLFLLVLAKTSFIRKQDFKSNPSIHITWSFFSIISIQVVQLLRILSIMKGLFQKNQSTKDMCTLKYMHTICKLAIFWPCKSAFGTFGYFWYWSYLLYYL